MKERFYYFGSKLIRYGSNILLGKVFPIPNIILMNDSNVDLEKNVVNQSFKVDDKTLNYTGVKIVLSTQKDKILANFTKNSTGIYNWDFPIIERNKTIDYYIFAYYEDENGTYTQKSVYVKDPLDPGIKPEVPDPTNPNEPNDPSDDEDFDIVIENITNNNVHIQYWGGGSVYAGDGDLVFFKFKTNNFTLDEYGDKIVYINKLIVNDRDYLNIRYWIDLDNGKLKLYSYNDDTFELEIGSIGDFEENEIIHLNINNQQIELLFKTVFSELELCSDAPATFENNILTLPIDWPVMTYGGNFGTSIGNREKYGFDLNEDSWIQLSTVGVEVYINNKLLFDQSEPYNWDDYYRYKVSYTKGNALEIHFKNNDFDSSLNNILIKPYKIYNNKKRYFKEYNYEYSYSEPELYLTIENPNISDDGYINFKLNLSDSDENSKYRDYEPPTLELYVNNKKTPDYWSYDELYWNLSIDYSYDNTDEVNNWFKSDKIDLKVIATFSDGKTITATESITNIPNILDGAHIDLNVNNYNNDGSYYIGFDSYGSYTSICSDTTYSVYVDGEKIYTSDITKDNYVFGDVCTDYFYSSENELDNLTAGEHTFKVILHTEFGDIESEEVTFDITVDEEE